jgi:hypothetical protein
MVSRKIYASKIGGTKNAAIPDTQFVYIADRVGKSAR